MRRLRIPILLLFLTIISSVGYHLFIKGNINSLFTLDSPWTLSAIIISSTYLFLKMADVAIWTPARIRGTIRAPRLFVDIMNIFIIAIITLLLAYKLFNQSFTGLLAASGAFGVILGISLQRIIADVFTGFAINMDRTVKIFDWIEYALPGKEPILGKVVEINWRTVKLLTLENNVLVIPNSALAKNLVTNKSVPTPNAMFSTEVTIDFEVAYDRVINLLTAATLAVKEVLTDPKPQVIIDRVTERGVAYSIRFWINIEKNNAILVQNKVLQSGLKHIHQSGLSLSYQKHDIYYKKMPKRQLDRFRDITPLLKRVPLFKMLNRIELEMIHSGISELICKPGAQIVKSGDPGSSMFIVVEGILDVVVDKIHKGRRVQVTVNKLEPGDFFGEMSLLTGELRSATVVSKTSSILYEIRKASIMKVLNSRPEVGKELSKILAERVIANNKFKVATDENKTKLATSLFSKMKRFLFG